jgi:small subunit ribosomal protein S4
MQKVKKFKLGKRLGADMFDKCASPKFAVSESRGAKTKKRRGNVSEFGRQLLQKQKVRFAYGITERQLGNYAEKAGKSKDPVSALNTLLEMRLDNIVYRAGVAASRREARQMVSHGHITVNGKKLRVPSHIVSVGDMVSVREGSKKHGTIAARTQKEEALTVPPKWISFDPKQYAVHVTEIPAYERTNSPFDFSSIFEFYSR